MSILLTVSRNSSLSDSSGRNTPTVSGHSSSAKQSCSSVVTEMTDDQDLEHAFLVIEPNASIHPCLFAFNGCTYASNNVIKWKNHCTEHFNKDQELLPSIDCFLCKFRADTSEDGTAWAQFLEHAALEHRNGQNASRPISKEGLLQFLLQRGVISELSLSKKEMDPDTSSPNPRSAVSCPYYRHPDIRAMNDSEHK
jgi:hypothetical protein